MKSAATIKEKYGKDFYKKIGSIGGKNGTTGGFAANRELAKVSGRKGGLVTKDKFKNNLKEKQDDKEA